ncbi:MAG: RDD family protein [Acidimicrobiia bacterium]|nr:RDD family protein [Acidimicrobiia bacterium]NDH47738.1 RDD family protein [Acidimicrobiia bacterium]
MNDYPPPPPLTDFSTGADRLASIGQRALAQVLDGLILVIPTMLISWSFSGRAFIDTSEDAGSEQLWILLLFLALQLIYNTTFVAMSGATPGKRIMKLRVVNRTDGSPVNWTYAAVRALVPTVAGVVPVIGFALNIAVYVRAAFHPFRQGLHDAAAGTIVVRR